METPIVFISSTSEDLTDYRRAAEKAVNKAKMHPEMMEYFAAGGNPPLPTCLEKVRPCDVLVVVVAHRYGWIPDDQEKSITWLECEQALKDGKAILAFLVDEKMDWPADKKEEFCLTTAMQAGTATPELFQQVNAAIQKLKEFKTWLKKKGTIEQFTSPASLETAILHALVEWQKTQAKFPAPTLVHPLEIPLAYQEWLGTRCGTVELLAHLTRQGCAPPRLSSVYVPAPTMDWEPARKPKKGEADQSPRREEKLHLLLDRFQKESLYVPGLAGSGKSTFTRWVAFLLCQGAMPEQVQLTAADPILEKFPSALQDKLPLLIPFREFWPFLPQRPGQRELSRQEFESALEGWGRQKLENLDDSIVRFLTAGKALLLLDGVDEIPVSHGATGSVCYPREMIVHGLKATAPVWRRAGNHLLLTSRPYGLSPGDAPEMGLPQADIIDLPRKLQQLFITRWFMALDYGVAMARDMQAHLDSRAELSELAGNPVMLMAMCVLFPEGKRLPQDKAELYQKTIDRMLFNRYRDSNEVEKVHHRLSVIAYGMHTGAGLNEQRATPQAATTTAEIDRLLEQYLELTAETEKGATTVTATREELLSRSGLLLQKDPRAVVFFHLSFQEYLAGRRLRQVSGDQFYAALQKYVDRPEWRQTLAFAFGSAFQDSPEKGLAILRQLLETTAIDRLAHLVLTADLLEIVYRKNYALDHPLVEKFRRLCLAAIETEVPVQNRYDLGRVLGLVGDPRMATDLRQFPNGYVKIPAGSYPVGKDKRKYEIKQPFWMTRYPVTNSQYRLFWEDGGYENEKWWPPAGWDWRRENEIVEPGYWRHGRWNGENLPVVGVSWYEAAAFAHWAGGELPGEWEWEAAARGPDGNEFPWGNPWEDGICNSFEAKLGTTSPVGLFPRSHSRDWGLVDLAGNVWEWCADCYKKGETARVLRGGAFSNLLDLLRCAYRYWYDPGFRSHVGGFRVVRRA